MRKIQKWKGVEAEARAKTNTRIKTRAKALNKYVLAHLYIYDEGKPHPKNICHTWKCLFWRMISIYRMKIFCLYSAHWMLSNCTRAFNSNSKQFKQISTLGWKIKMIKYLEKQSDFCHFGTSSWILCLQIRWFVDVEIFFHVGWRTCYSQCSATATFSGNPKNIG